MKVRYAKGVENKPWLGQGLRFGIVLWLILAVPSFFIAYAVQPVPTMLMVKQVLFEGIDRIYSALLPRRYIARSLSAEYPPTKKVASCRRPLSSSLLGSFTVWRVLVLGQRVYGPHLILDH